MTQEQTVLVKKGESLVSYQPISPNCWQGESSCLIGPFSSKEVAEYFAYPLVNHGPYDVVIARIFAKGNAWYVEVIAD